MLWRPRSSGRQEHLWIASFWNPTQPFRLAGACGFQLIICIPTNSAQEAISQRGWQGAERQPSGLDRLEVYVRHEGREKAKDVVNQPLDDFMKPSPATECVQQP